MKKFKEKKLIHYFSDFFSGKKRASEIHQDFLKDREFIRSNLFHPSLDIRCTVGIFRLGLSSNDETGAPVQEEKVEINTTPVISQGSVIRPRFGR